MKLYSFLNKSLGDLQKKSLPVVVVDKTNYFSFPFFVLGALVGAIAALLYTPDTGENMRRKITDKLKNVNQEKDPFAGRQTYNVGDISSEGERSLEELRTRMEDI